MKKKLSLAIGIVAAAAILGLGIYHSDASQTEPKLSKADIKTMLANQYPGEITSFELDRDFNKSVYEVEIEGKNKAYDLTLDADTGEVLKIDEKTIATNDKEQDDSLVVREKEEAKQKEQEKQKEIEKKEAAKKKAEEKKKQEQAKKKQEQLAKKKEQQAKREEQKKQNNSKVAISVQEAADIAQKAFPGTITELELDEED